MLLFCVQVALMKVIQGQARKGPLRYLERIKVDTVRLGKQQPALSTCTASTDAGAGCVQLALPFSFAPAEGFSIVVSTPSSLIARAAAIPETTLANSEDNSLKCGSAH